MTGVTRVVQAPIVLLGPLARPLLRVLSTGSAHQFAAYSRHRPDVWTLLMPEQPPPRRTQQERREQTERKVIAAATALIAEHGSRALTLAEVGKTAGYSRGIVTHHFGSRENLLRAVMRDAQTFDSRTLVRARESGSWIWFAPTWKTSPTNPRLPARS